MATSTDAARPLGASVVALRFDGDTLWALDQTQLPWREEELALRSAEDVAGALKRLAIRGAPLIGVAGAFGVALELAADSGRAALDRATATLRTARPTAVNLARQVDRVRAAALAVPDGEMAAAARAAAEAIYAEEKAASAAMGAHGATLLAGRRRILTHCNTGALAGPGRGTALSVVAELAERGQLDGVIACEARPLLQGARLTVYELARLGIAHELIVDAAAAGLMRMGAVDAVVLGCDRVAANGDVANKVGTYGLALAASAAGIPFVVVGPTSSIDPEAAGGEEIAIEERDADEVRLARGEPLTMPGTRCRNPAFDVTPAELVTALVTERGAASPVTGEAIAALLA
ncbi:MAG TPA: S-methyl-5-thioribose-1-phosphate isomerase [Solirubrobacteraceae bacterium]|jgi:methylthioribose-1-phosphate isomerase|nr:S-methyl-5-thioribose-1-phosphate isomerase [Solirubrobacteraceae bacterium]